MASSFLYSLHPTNSKDTMMQQEEEEVQLELVEIRPELVRIQLALVEIQPEEVSISFCNLQSIDIIYVHP